MLGRLRKHLTSYAADTLYRSFMVSVLEYCSCTWSCCNKRDIELLERLQQRVARIVMKMDSSDSALVKLNWESLDSRRKKHVLKLVEKCLKNQVPQFFTGYFTFNRDIVHRKTRKSNLLHLPKVRTKAGKIFFYHNGRIVFNSFDSWLSLLVW